MFSPIEGGHPLLWRRPQPRRAPSVMPRRGWSRSYNTCTSYRDGRLPDAW